MSLRPIAGRRPAGLDREWVTLHTLRHTFASLLLQEGYDLASMKAALGHSDLATTSIYLQVSAPHLQAAVGLHPLSRRIYSQEESVFPLRKWPAGS